MTGPVAREIWSGDYRIRLDLSRQILDLSVPEEPVDPRETSAGEQTIQPTLQEVPKGGFVAAGLLVQKAKQFDDGLYAAVELAAEKGAGRFSGKAALLSGVARALSARPDTREACALMLAARRLIDAKTNVPADLTPLVDRTVNGFLADERESKPLGFYTWSPELEAIFRQGRLLQRPLSDATMQALVHALRSDEGLRDSYEACLTLTSYLTNPPALPDLRSLAASPHMSLPPSATQHHFFPPSASHEAKLAERLVGTGPVPEGFSLIDEMIRAISARTLKVEPTSDSGWYDYQTWAHEPFVIPWATPETQRLRLDESYRKEVLELFKGAQALARETHVQLLVRTTLGISSKPRKEARVIRIAPGLTVEPLATFYQRRALGYRFIHGVLGSAFGTEGLRQLRRLTPDGPAPTDLDTELAAMEAMFHGAYATVAAQIGMPADPGAGSTGATQQFAAWARDLSADTDLSRDARMMVPIFYDQPRGMTKAWVFLGWSRRFVSIGFGKVPTAEMFDAAGRPVVESDDLKLGFVSERHVLLSPVTAEVYVTRLLNRAEFRAHCDRFKTRSAILSALR